MERGVDHVVGDGGVSKCGHDENVKKGQTNLWRVGVIGK